MRSTKELLGVVLTVEPNEKALRLEELNLPALNSKSIHRFQIITVVRADSPAKYSVDMGARANFTADEFTIPSFMEHTVAELQGIADQFRESPPMSYTMEPLTIREQTNRKLSKQGSTPTKLVIEV